LDESAVTPTGKAHYPPFQHEHDEVRLRVDLQLDGVCVDGAARVRRGMLHGAVNYALVCAVTIVTVTVAVLLCHLWGANGWIALAIAAVCGGLILAIGLARTSPRRVQAEPAPPQSTPPPSDCAP
jgi:hypothetical protein